MRNQALLFSLALCVGWLGSPRQSFAAPIVWTGPTISFAKSSGADPTLPQNQDFLTPQVILTRGSVQGIFNIALETGFASTSPADTQWATDLGNPSQSITATNFAALTFTNWAAAYNSNPTGNAVGRAAVVHLIRDDIYLDLRFTGFQGGTPGGAFSYQRSTPVPEPASFGLVLLGLASCLTATRKPLVRFSETRPGRRACPRQQLERVSAARAPWRAR
jgi:hypothetical protein